jgi:plastocyanin domain-containing protein
MQRGLVAILLVLSMSGCTSGINRPTREVTATTGTDRIQHVTIRTHSYYFDPNRVVVQKGVPVELTIRNAALFVPHNFSCDAPEAGIHVDAPLGMFFGSKRVRFTPTAAGEYPFHCHVDAHATKGMTGTLVVKS